MTQADLDALKALLHEGFKHAEDFNKIYLGIGTLIGVFVGVLVQMWIARRSRASQEGIANSQIKMQEAMSKRVARDNISAKRQVWIDELRKDMAEYLSVCQQMNMLFDDVSSSALFEVKPFIEAQQRFRVQSHLLSTRIRLRLNPTELKHARLVTLMRVVERRAYGLTSEAAQTAKVSGQAMFARSLDLIVRRTQRILKDEWNRIKREELTP